MATASAARSGAGPARNDALAEAGAEGDSHETSPGDLPTAPAREVALSSLYKRSEPLCITHASLARGLDSARRLDALEWLVQAFDALNLPDAQLFAAFGLLDRFAAMSTAPISAGPGAFALVLASMLVALKVLGTPKDLERGKRLVVEVSGSSRPWQAVRRAEVQILRRLSFRACTPTARDLLDRILDDALVQSQDLVDGELRSRCGDLARFLLEISTVHDPEAVYGPGRAPLAAALAALLLALLALGAPKQCAEAAEKEPIRLLGRENGPAIVRELGEAMRHRWAQEERRASSGAASAVMEKWMRRVGQFGASPPSPGELRFLVSSRHVAQSSEAADLASSARRVSVTSAGQQAEIIAALPTPARHASQGAEHPSGRASLQPQRDDPAKMEGKLKEEARTKEAAHEDQKEQKDSLANAGRDRVESLPLPEPEVTTLSGTGASSSGAERTHEPLVELTHVLNLVAPRPQQGTGTAKGQQPTVAAELLISSSLRMQWPVDKRKVPSGDAAKTCREAAAVLQEAAAQLTAAAASLDGGSNLVSRESLKPAIAAETKRRRTFGGGAGAPPKATSPPPVSSSTRGSTSGTSGGMTLQRGSPPVARYAGLRV